MFEVTNFDKVAEFHATFGHPLNDKPTKPNPDEARLRLSLIFEEFVELTESLVDENSEIVPALKEMLQSIRKIPDQDITFDPVAAADALADILYVTYGTGHSFGLPLDECMEEVHSSNMSKLDAFGEPIYNEFGKVVKGPDYRPPQLENIVFGQLELL